MQKTKEIDSERRFCNLFCRWVELDARFRRLQRMDPFGEKNAVASEINEVLSEAKNIRLPVGDDPDDSFAPIPGTPNSQIMIWRV